MRESKASRTLLKSPPELWSEVSTATSLQRHMDQFGEIRITKLEPETAVAWEGEHARGTITLEVSGWGTKVCLTAEPTVNGAIDANKPEAAGRAEPDPVTDRVGPEGLGERVEPAPATNLAAAKPATTVDPAEAAGPEIPDRTIPPQHDRLDASMQRPRWTRRVVEALRKWFSPPLDEEAERFSAALEEEAERFRPRLDEEAEAPAHAPEPKPEQPAPWSTQVAPKFDRLVAPRTPAAPLEPTPRQEPPPQIDEASTAALDATLDSLGQAHHRPFSRA